MRQTNRIIVMAACLVLAGAASAVAAGNPNYIKFNGKYTRMSDMDITGQVQLDSEEGYGFGAALGRSFGWLRFEAEIATQENDINNFEVRGVGGRTFKNVDTTIDSLMLNGYVDIPVADAFSLFAGGGVGGAAVTVSVYDYEVDETVFAYKLAAGASYQFNDNWGTELAYEYLATDDISYNLIEVEDISSSNLVLSLKFMF